MARDLDAGRELARAARRQLESGGPAVAGRADCRALLCDRTAPICVSRADAGGWLTFGAVVDWSCGDTVTMDVALGPPDETPWIELELGR